MSDESKALVGIANGTDPEMTFSAIVQNRYGEPDDVLRLVDWPVASLNAGSGDVMIHVTKRPIHPGDLHMVRGAANGGQSAPIDPNNPRVPGFEGVGWIKQLGDKVKAEGKFKLGQRVAFFSLGARAWATHVVVPVSAVVAVPEFVADGVAAQMLINTITALVALKAGHNSLPEGFDMPVYALQTAAGSAVNRLITSIAVSRGVKPILLVRSTHGARELNTKQPDVPVFATDDPDWKEQVRGILNGRPLHVAKDAVGGSFIDEIASVISDGATIISFGWLGKGAPDLSSFAPRELTISGVTMGRWAVNNDTKQQAADIQLAIDLASKSPELYEVEAEYPLEDFQKAIEHATRPGKNGIVLLTS